MSTVTKYSTFVLQRTFQTTAEIKLFISILLLFKFQFIVTVHKFSSNVLVLKILATTQLTVQMRYLVNIRVTNNAFAQPYSELLAPRHTANNNQVMYSWLEIMHNSTQGVCLYLQSQRLCCSEIFCFFTYVLVGQLGIYFWVHVDPLDTPPCTLRLRTQ